MRLSSGSQMSRFSHGTGGMGTRDYIFFSLQTVAHSPLHQDQHGDCLKCPFWSREPEGSDWAGVARGQVLAF